MAIVNKYIYSYRNEARGVMGVIPHESIRLLYFIKHKDDTHVPAKLQKLAIAIDCLVFEPSN